MCDNRKKPQIFYIQLAVSLDGSTLALLSLRSLGPQIHWGSFPRGPWLCLGRWNSAGAVVGAYLLIDGTLSSFPSWEAGEQTLELNFVPGTMTS